VELKENEHKSENNPENNPEKQILPAKKILSFSFATDFTFLFFPGYYSRNCPKSDK
jgi:hypothetical protein